MASRSCGLSTTQIVLRSRLVSAHTKHISCSDKLLHNLQKRMPSFNWTILSAKARTFSDGSLKSQKTMRSALRRPTPGNFDKRSKRFSINLGYMGFYSLCHSLTTSRSEE